MADSSGGSPGPGWMPVTNAAELAPGLVMGVQVGEEQVVLANVDGDFYALEDRCSHQDFPLSSGGLEGSELECPFHGAKFDVRTGRALQLPAVRPVRTFDVQVVDGRVYLRQG